MIGLFSQQRATKPVESRYCSVYARNGGTVASNASKESTALSRLRIIDCLHQTQRVESRRSKSRGWPPSGGRGKGFPILPRPQRSDVSFSKGV